MTKIDGSISNSIINVDSVLQQVTQNIGAAVTIDQETKKALTGLVEHLKRELQKAPPEKREEAEAIAESAKVLVEAGTKPKPNRTTIQITAEGLERTAETISDIMPTVLGVVSSIVKTVFLFSGNPLP